MSFSNFPLEAGHTLVADASVVINLNATGCASKIIQAQPHPLVVTDNAVVELMRGTRNGHRDGDMLQSLIGAGTVQRVQLGEDGNGIYAELVEGSALHTLDDGEAATIGYAHEIGGVAMIDEKKARTICEARFSGLTVLSTVDLLAHRLVADALGEQGQADAIINALRDARMRVPPHQIEMVVGLIGKEAAAGCHSLPRAVRSAGTNATG